ncbi:MAG: hypothetical protein ACI39R_02975 [Lachnospiraceae bacterium]
MKKTIIKTFLVFSLMVLMSLTLCACGKKDSGVNKASESDANEKPGLTTGADDGTQSDTLDEYFYVTEDKSVGLGNYLGVTYTPIDTSVTDEELQKVMDDTLEYFRSIMEIESLSDEIVSEFYDGYETVEELENAFRNIIHEKNEQKASMTYQEEVLDKIVESSDIFVDLTEEASECYSSLVTHYNTLAVAENKTLEEYMVQTLGLDAENWHEQLAEDATILTYRHKILLAVAEAENLSISEEAYETKIGIYMEYYGYDNRELFEQEFTKESIEQNMLEDMALEFVMSKAVPADNF